MDIKTGKKILNDDLIAVIQGHPYIYDKSMDKYKTHDKTQTWKEIAHVAGFPEERKKLVPPDCFFGHANDAGGLSLPTASVLPGSTMKSPYFFVGDGAFPLLTNLMKPFGGTKLTHQQHIYNYRISRARRIIENIFGIMCCKWRILFGTIESGPEMADCITKAIAALHNYCLDECSIDPLRLADERDQSNGMWRRLVPEAVCQPVQPRQITRSGIEAICVRNKLVNFVNGVGAVE